MAKVIFAVFLVVLSMTSGDLSAKDAWTKSSAIMKYLTKNYQYLDAALENDTYNELRDFEPRLYLGVNITHHFPSNTSLSHALLIGATWSDTKKKQLRFDFSFADISFADFVHADLSECDLSNAKAFKVNLSYALLNCQMLRGCDLSGAQLRNTKMLLNGRITYVTEENLLGCGAIIDQKTQIRMPLDHTMRRSEDWLMLPTKS